MIWVFAGIVALGVLVAAAFAGLGRFGQMPDAPILDRPRGRVPDGPVTDAMLAELTLPKAPTGYDRAAVDEYLREIADGTAIPASEKKFKVVSEGYDMHVVDNILARERYERPTAVDADFTRPEPDDAGPEPDPDEPMDGDWERLPDEAEEPRTPRHGGEAVEDEGQPVEEPHRRHSD